MERKELYITALIFNLNRFIEETVISHRTFIADSLPECTILSQRIIGDYTAVTGIFGDPDTMMKFAAQYSKFEVTRYDSLCHELLGDFLNLHNGLFVVNLSDSESIESTLEPPEMKSSELIRLLKTTYIMPVQFSFGTINFVLSE